LVAVFSNILDPDQDSAKCLDLDPDLVNPPKHWYGTSVCFALSLCVAYDSRISDFDTSTRSARAFGRHCSTMAGTVHAVVPTVSIRVARYLTNSKLFCFTFINLSERKVLTYCSDPSTNCKGDNDPIDVCEIGQTIHPRYRYSPKMLILFSYPKFFNLNQRVTLQRGVVYQG
jgi:hypothetical protein